MAIYNWRQDPDTPKLYEILDKVLAGDRKKIVMIFLSPQQIKQNINLLSQGSF